MEEDEVDMAKLCSESNSQSIAQKISENNEQHNEDDYMEEASKSSDNLQYSHQ